jgi:hypothetical protein
MSCTILASGDADAVHIICDHGHHHLLGHAEARRLYLSLGQVLGLPTDPVALPEVTAAPDPPRP